MKKILLVEDDPLLSNLYKTFLVNAGYQVFTARDKDSGLNIALTDQPDFILLDVMLASNTSGIDLLTDLRNDEKGKDIPVIMLTNVAKDEERDKAFSLGVKNYMLKAAQSPEEVVSEVKKYLV